MTMVRSWKAHFWIWVQCVCVCVADFFSLQRPSVPLGFTPHSFHSFRIVCVVVFVASIPIDYRHKIYGEIFEVFFSRDSHINRQKTIGLFQLYLNPRANLFVRGNSWKRINNIQSFGRHALWMLCVLFCKTITNSERRGAKRTAYKRTILTMVANNEQFEHWL